MSDPNDKFKHSKRLHQEENAIHKQQKIAKSHGAPEHQYQGHRFSKHHAMDCGNPRCYMCANPRRTWGEKTIQETKFECQAVEQTNRDSIGKWEWEDLNDPAIQW